MSRQVETGLSVIAFILLSLFLAYGWVRRNVSTSSGPGRTVFALSAFLFLVSAPCFYLVIMGAGLVFSVFRVLLAVASYRFFYGAEVTLSNIWFEPVLAVIFGVGGVGQGVCQVLGGTGGQAEKLWTMGLKDVMMDK